MGCMNTVAYALATALLLIAVAAPIAAAEDGQTEPEEAPPCHAFQYSLDPPDAAVRPHCITLPPPLG